MLNFLTICSNSTSAVINLLFLPSWNYLSPNFPLFSGNEKRCTPDILNRITSFEVFCVELKIPHTAVSSGQLNLSKQVGMLLSTSGNSLTIFLKRTAGLPFYGELAQQHRRSPTAQGNILSSNRNQISICKSGISKDRLVPLLLIQI